MISKEIVKYSIKNIWNRKARNLLTIFSIFIGISTIFIFLSFGLGLYNYVEDITLSGSADKIVVQTKGINPLGLDDTFHLTGEDLNAVKKATGVYNAAGASFEAAKVEQGKEKKYVFLTSYDPKNPLVMEIFNVDIIKGENLKSGERGKAVLGYNYLVEDKIFPKTYEINDKITVQEKELRIVGFFDSVGNPQDDSNIYVTQKYKEKLYDENETTYNWIIAKVDMEKLDKVVQNVERNLRKSRDLEEGEEDFFVQSFQEMIDSYSVTLDIIIGFVILIALISVLVSAINTTNTMVTSVLERIKEIGIIKSIGAKNSEIFKIFLFESSFLGLIAGIMGVLFGWALTSIADKIIQDMGWGFLSPHYSIWVFAGCILFALITGAISGSLPAWDASKTNPVDALRYE